MRTAKQQAVAWTVRLTLGLVAVVVAASCATTTSKTRHGDGGSAEGSAVIDSQVDGISQSESAAARETLDELLDLRMQMSGLPGYR